MIFAISNQLSRICQGDRSSVLAPEVRHAVVRFEWTCDVGILRPQHVENFGLSHHQRPFQGILLVIRLHGMLREKPTCALDEAGEPATSAQVRLMRSVVQNGRRTFQPWGNGTADS